MSVLYHPAKANVVADDLICMTIGSVSHIEKSKTDLVKDVHMLARLGVRLEDSLNCGFMVHHNSESSLVVEVKSKQHLDKSLIELNKSVLLNLNEAFSLGENNYFMYQERLCFTKLDELRNRILEESFPPLY